MTLTPKQIEVMELAIQGLNSREIAEKLNLSPYTISTHLRYIRAKLNVKTTANAIKKYKRMTNDNKTNKRTRG